MPLGVLHAGYAVIVSTPAAVLVALAVGLLIGVAFTALMHLARRQRERTAEALEARIPEGVDTVLGALAEISIVCDPSYNVRRASPGATQTGLVTRRGRLAEQLEEIAGAAWVGDGPVEAEIIIPRGPYGRAELTFEVRAARLLPRFILILARDVTESIRIEAVRRDFVANVSHELKTPIGAISLLSEAVVEAADQPDQVVHFAGRMLTEAERLGRLTRELIDLSRLQAGDALESAEPIELGPLLTRAAERSRVAADAKGIRVLVRASAGTEVIGDADLLDMCIRNLITNAIAYAPAESTVGVGARRVGDTVEISVADRGIGIAPEDQGRIFERFYRVDSARARNTGGTGLGLAIAKHVAENHGGDISVWSKLGEGSTFTVRLPAAETLVPEDAETEPPRTESIRLP